MARYLGALILVLGLLGCAWLATRKYGVPGLVQAKATRRLSISETLMIGPRHKLLLIRRDGVEHLVLMGPQGASVVENGIAPIAANASAAGATPHASPFKGEAAA